MGHVYHLPVYFLMLSFQVTFIRMERGERPQEPNTAISCGSGEGPGRERLQSRPQPPTHSLYFPDVMERRSVSN